MEGASIANVDQPADCQPKQTFRPISSYFASTPNNANEKRKLSTPSPDSQAPSKLPCNSVTPVANSERIIEHDPLSPSSLCSDVDCRNMISGNISTSMDDFKEFLTQTVDSYKTGLLKHIQRLEVRVTECETGLTAQDERIQELEKENIDMKERNTVLEGRILRCEHFIDKVRDKVVTLETRSMRDNIIFYNLPERDPEDPVATILQFLTNEMNLGSVIAVNNIYRCHRMGRRHAQSKYPRAIICHLDPKSCDIIMKNAHKLKGKPYRLSIQVPREVEEKRKHLLPIFKEAKAKNEKPYWVQDVLRVGDKEHKVSRHYRT